MYAKLIVRTEIEVLTGLHIGGSKMFSAIGAVDMPVITDPWSHRPIIPGSSLKGKLRALLSRSMSNGKRCEPGNDNEKIKRLFGCSEPIILSRLQFSDCFVTDRTLAQLGENRTLTEIKFENTISRITGKATPRQAERVNRGVCFECSIAYNAENESEIEEDMKNLAHALKLLQMDYLGGHGTRGSGRVAFRDVRLCDPEGVLTEEKRAKLEGILKEVESYAVLSDKVAL